MSTRKTEVAFGKLPGALDIGVWKSQIDRKRGPPAVRINQYAKERR